MKYSIEIKTALSLKVRVGEFETFEEAVYAREEAEKQYYGDFRGGRYVN